MNKSIFTLIVVLFFSGKNLAQGEGALPFLIFPNSIQSYGNGWTGVSNPTDESSGYYFNPAILGANSKNKHFSFSFQPTETEWMKNYFPETIISSYGFSAGYNLTDKIGVPLSVGVGFIKSKIEFGITSNIFNNLRDLSNLSAPYDEFNTFSIGVNVDYAVSVSFGFSYKDYSSVIIYDTPVSSSNASATGSAFDFGVLAEVTSKKIFSNSDFWNFKNKIYRPILGVALGYSISNIGKEIYFVDEAQKDPISRIMRLGYSITTGFDFLINRKIISALNYTFSAEAADILVKRDISMGINYKGPFGDLKPFKNLLMVEGDSDIKVHRGHSFTLFETVFISSGRIHGSNTSNAKTSGYGLSTRGLFKLFSSISDDQTVKFIFDHLVIQYNHANVFSDTSYETELDGMSVRFVNLNLW